MKRKVFRIEQMMAGNGAREGMPVASASDPIALHELVMQYKRDLVALMHDGEHRRMSRAAGELGAAIEAMETATHSILRSAEEIDAQAQTLAVSAGPLARGIQDNVAQIYEACNFQDIAGQRIAKVIEILAMVEEHLAAMITPDDAAQATLAPTDALVNGPRLDGASGHVSQREIDLLFG